MRLFGRRESGASGEENGSYQATASAVAEGPRPVGRDGGAKAHSNGASEQAILLTPEGWLVGHLDAGDGREPDVDEVLAKPVVRVTSADGPRMIDRDDVMMLVPPAGSAQTHEQSSKRALPVAVDLGVATLRGVFYALPGVSAWETWQRATSGFVPVSGTVLDFPDGTSDPAGLVLLSRHAVHSGLIPG